MDGIFVTKFKSDVFGQVDEFTATSTAGRIHLYNNPMPDDKDYKDPVEYIKNHSWWSSSGTQRL